MTIIIPFWLFATAFLALVLLNAYIVLVWIPRQLGPAWRDWMATKVIKAVIWLCATWITISNQLDRKTHSPDSRKEAAKDHE